MRLIAYYLPQFYPTPENDLWWGKGFTEWTNVTKARPLFPGHRQPVLPGELGFYDLRIPEAREAQADLARAHGIEGFCYWHYWFGNGRKVLDRPFAEVLQSGKPDFGFCLAWANLTWSTSSYGEKTPRTLIEQLYPGDHDIRDHFFQLLPAFHDNRYLRIDNKPIFQVNHPNLLPDPRRFIGIWNELAVNNGLDGIYFIAHDFPGFDFRAHGFDGLNFFTPAHLYRRYRRSIIVRKAKSIFGLDIPAFVHYRLKKPLLYDYSGIVAASDYSDIPIDNDVYPCAIPGWDHSPRSGNRASIIHRASPELFLVNLKNCFAYVQDRCSDKQLVFIKSWNEWAEGNILEPDSLNGRAYLEAVAKLTKTK